jgi:hypothetical protein
MFLTKWASLLIPLYSFSLFGNESKLTSYILEVKKKSNLFDKPSPRATVVGQADEGTNLIFIDESIHGRWVKIQDSEGSVGWIPKDRTDFEEIKKIVDLDVEPKEKIIKEKVEVQNKPELTPAESKNKLSSFYRIFSSKSRISSLLGLRYDLKMGYLNLNEEKKGDQIISFEAGVPLGLNKLGDVFSGAFRVNMKAPLIRKLYYITDYGYSFQKSNTSLNHHLSLGLSAGVAMSWLDARVRGGFDFFSGSYSTIEVQLGCLF